MTSNAATTMVSVYDGQECLGFVLRRHWSNGLAVAYEAFDAHNHSLGIFETQDAAGRSRRTRWRSISRSGAPWTSEMQCHFEVLDNLRPAEKWCHD